MDVQTLGQLPALGSSGDPTTASVTPEPVQAASPAAGIGTPPVSSDPAPRHEGLPAFQLPREVAKVFSGGAASNVAISFHVAHAPNEIVTVFKNSETGEIITQVPSEIMVQIAEFFDKVAGVLLDKLA